MLALKRSLLFFQESLHSLMATLSASNPFFVRCIKPNMAKVGPISSKCFSLLSSLQVHVPAKSFYSIAAVHLTTKS